MDEIRIKRGRAHFWQLAPSGKVDIALHASSSYEGEEFVPKVRYFPPTDDHGEFVTLLVEQVNDPNRAEVCLFLSTELAFTLMQQLQSVVSGIPCHNTVFPAGDTQDLV